MHWSLVLACVAALGVSHAQPAPDLPPELLQLAKIKVHMQQTLARQPNYTCVEQIERSRRRGPRSRFELLDMVRLEVALVDGQEMFAWPGSAKFEEAELKDLVPQGGAIGNGNFALFARSVFQTTAPAFTYSGTTELNGRKAIRYDYVVPQMQSGFHLRVNELEAVVGFHGSFWADPETLDVLRLSVVADNVPPMLGLDKSTTVMDYARVRIGERDFLLPASSELSMTHLTGDEDRNYVRFSGCRQYTGESVLTFGEAPADATPPDAPAAPVVEVIELPVDLEFDIALDAGIDNEKSMVGDPVTGRLRQAIKHEKRVLFEKGDIVSGRIRRLERHIDHFLLAIDFTEIVSSRRRATMRAIIDEAPVSNLYLRPSGFARGVNPHPNDAGGLTVRGTRMLLKAGFRVRLRSQLPAPRKPA